MKNIIALVDSGVNKKNCIRKEKITIDTKFNEYEENRTLHGTLCASIIQGINEEIDIYSIEILDENERTNYRKLQEVLEYLKDIDVKIINLSMATVNEKARIALEKACDILVEQGKIIVAAVDNLRGEGYPASLKNVIGVKGLRTMCQNEFWYNAEYTIQCACDMSPVLVPIDEQGDIAVIARTNKDLLGLGKLIDAFNMEHQNSEKLRFFKPKYYLYQDSVYQTVLDLLSLHQGILTDDYIWYRLLSKLGVSVQKAHSDKCIYESYLEDQAIYPFTGEEAGRYLLVSEGGSQLLNAVAKLYKASRLFSLPAADAISKVLDFFYEGRCNGEVREILETMIRERHIRTASELWHYMTAIKFFDDETRVYMEGDSTNAIHLLTAHDSKGKEYKAVIVYGVDDFELDNLQEDRRLLYVAVTRAKERLYLTEVCKGKSMFLKEIKLHVEEIGGLRYA